MLRGLVVAVYILLLVPVVVVMTLLEAEFIGTSTGFWKGSTVAQVLSSPWAVTCTGGTSSNGCGAALNITDGVVANDANDRRGFDVNCTVNDINANSGFSDQNCMQVSLTANHGQSVYGSGTNAKRTFLPFSVTGNYPAAGQKFLFGNTINCYGMDDCAIWGNNAVTYAGGPVAGDEGTGWGDVSAATQQANIVISSLTGNATQTSCNTGLTQNVTGGYTGQAATVKSTTNCNTNDWMVGNQVLPNFDYGSPNNEAVQLTNVNAGAGTVSGVFQNNYTVQTPTLSGYISNGTSGVAGTILTITSGPSGTLYIGATLGAPATAGTTITGFNSGTGTYNVSISQATGTSGSPASFTATYLPPITPALVLALSGTSQFGEGRKLVNLSQPQYSTGTVTAINGGVLTGSGTSWVANMVGGSAAIGGNSSAANYGCIALTADDYIGNPFGGPVVDGSSHTAIGTGGTGGVPSTTLTISAMSSGVFTVGQQINGTGVTISALGTGYGGTGTYTLSSALTIANGTTINATGGSANAGFSGYISNGTSGVAGKVLTVTSVAAGAVAWNSGNSSFIPGEQLSLAGVNVGTIILSQLTGSGGGTGTYSLGGASQALGTSGSPVNLQAAMTLKSWYEITSVASTSVGISSMSVAGDLSYHGQGPGPTGSGGGSSTYAIRPCVEVLRINGNQVIGESTSTTWSNNDIVELAISPYPDVTGFEYSMAKWNPGGNARGFMNVVNTGARQYGYGFNVTSNMSTGSNADAVGWANAYAASGVGVGLNISNTTQGAIQLDCGVACNGTSTLPDLSGRIAWGNGAYIQTDGTTAGLELQLDASGSAPGNGGFLVTYGHNSGQLGSGNNWPGLQFGGVFGTAPKTYAALNGSLPCTSAVEGFHSAVTDAVYAGQPTITIGAVITGGSGSGASAHVDAYCNGTNWVVH